MPTYQYSCTECGHFLEERQSFTDDALTVCPECGGRLRKVFGAVGVVFKGSGFYRTDSRGKDPSASEGSTSEGTKSDTKSDAKAGAKAGSDSGSSSGSSGGSGSNGATSGAAKSEKKTGSSTAKSSTTTS